MKDTAAIIRFCYEPGADEENVRWRLCYFARSVLPLLIPQADVWVWVHPRHREQIAALHPAIHTFTVRLDHPAKVAFENTTLTGFPWCAVEGLPRYSHQLLLGSDDLIAPDFVAASKAALIWAPVRAIASHHPLFLDLETHRTYRAQRRIRPSPMLLLRQRVEDPLYTWVWADDHRFLSKKVDQVEYIDEGRAVMTLHRYNDGTALTPRMMRVPCPRWLEAVS